MTYGGRIESSLPSRSYDIEWRTWDAMKHYFNKMKKEVTTQEGYYENLPV